MIAAAAVPPTGTGIVTKSVKPYRAVRERQSLGIVAAESGLLVEAWMRVFAGVYGKRHESGGWRGFRTWQNEHAECFL